MKHKAILIGPFVGELCWEFFRFAPYVIHLKKNNPKLKLIVLTRPSRFDLYGQYATFLVPLRLKKDLKSRGFGMVEYLDEDYFTLVEFFRKKYKKRFHIIDHCYPDIRGWRYKVRWQFPRDQMNYDFQPRKENIEVARKCMRKNIGIIDRGVVENINERDDIISSFDLFARITNFTTNNSTSLGTLIECIKLAKFVVGDINYDTSHLSLLLKTPLIHIGKRISEDYMKLMNPLKTPVIMSDSVRQGVKIYETM